MNICGIEFEEIGVIRDNTPLVSVWCLTFNQKEYIMECLDSILAQKVDFEYEIVVYDDVSTDGTTDILRDYCKRYPGKIRVLLPNKNTYKDARRWYAIKYIKSKLMRGKYIAYCEGDDYWCDENKLKLQVDFLENHLEYSLVLHNAERLNCASNQKNVMFKNRENGTILPKEIIRQKNGMWPTASMLGRKEIWAEMPEFCNCGIGDWASQLFACTLGKVYYMSNVMSVYRFMLPGSWSIKTYNDWKKLFVHTVRMVFFLNIFNQFTRRKFEDEIRKRIAFFMFFFCDVSEMNIDDIQEVIENINIKYGQKYEDLLEKVKEIILDISGKQVVPVFSKEEIQELYGDKEVWIFSASTAGKRVLKILECLNIKIKGFIDNDQNKSGKKINGYPIICASEMEKIRKNKIVIQVASPEYNEEICTQLEEKKWIYCSVDEFAKKVFNYSYVLTSC